MVWCINLAEFEEYLYSNGFVFIGRTELHKVYRRANAYLTLRVGSSAAIPVTEMESACDQAGVAVPSLDQFFNAP